MAELCDAMRRCSLESVHPFRDIIHLRLTHATPPANERSHREDEEDEEEQQQQQQQFGGCSKVHPSAESNSILPIRLSCSLLSPSSSELVNDVFLGRSEPPAEEDDFGLSAARSRIEARLTQRSLSSQNNDDKIVDHPTPSVKSRRRNESNAKTKAKPTTINHCTAGTIPTIRITPAAAEASTTHHGHAIDAISMTTRQWNQRRPLSNRSSTSAYAQQRMHQRIEHPIYVDPLCKASPRFHKRIAEMALLEQETKRWEKTMRLKRMSLPS